MVPDCLTHQQYYPENRNNRFNRYKQNDLFERTYTFLPKYTWFCDIWEEICIYINLYTFRNKNPSSLGYVKGTNRFRWQKSNVIGWVVQTQSYPIASRVEVRLMNGWSYRQRTKKNHGSVMAIGNISSLKKWVYYELRFKTLVIFLEILVGSTEKPS